MNETRGLVEVIDAIWGGAITTMAAALAGRLMWHCTPASTNPAPHRPNLTQSITNNMVQT